MLLRCPRSVPPSLSSTHLEHLKHALEIFQLTLSTQLERTGRQRSAPWRRCTTRSACARWTPSSTTSPPPTSRRQAAVPGWSLQSSNRCTTPTTGCFRPPRKAASCPGKRLDDRSKIQFQTPNCLPHSRTSNCANKLAVIEHILKPEIKFQLIVGL